MLVVVVALVPLVPTICNVGGGRASSAVQSYVVGGGILPYSLPL